MKASASVNDESNAENEKIRARARPVERWLDCGAELNVFPMILAAPHRRTSNTFRLSAYHDVCVCVREMAARRRRQQHFH